MPEESYTLTYQQVAELLGKSRRTVQRYVEEGKLSKDEVMTKTGQRVYFSEAEVKKLQQELQEPRRGDRGGDTSSQRTLALQTMVMGLQNQLDKKDDQLEKKEEKIEKLNRELGRMEGQMKDQGKLAEERRRLGENLKKEQEEKVALEGEIGGLRKSLTRGLLTVNLIYIIAILVAAAILFWPRIQSLLTR
ncbi:MAG: helix-turn-helix domain-containing protein [Candidatus Bipolaricaulia bacterium]